MARRAPGVAVPEWARALLTSWGQKLDEYLQIESPDHVIAKDRRGAKVWTLLKPKKGTLGEEPLAQYSHRFDEFGRVVATVCREEGRPI